MLLHWNTPAMPTCCGYFGRNQDQIKSRFSLYWSTTIRHPQRTSNHLQQNHGLAGIFCFVLELAHKKWVAPQCKQDCFFYCQKYDQRFQSLVRPPGEYWNAGHFLFFLPSQMAIKCSRNLTKTALPKLF